MSVVELLKSVRSRLDERRKKSKWGKGAKRGKYKTSANSKNVAQKSRVKNYDTIRAALKAKGPGHIFSTDGSRRLYVISKRTKGGTDDYSEVGGKIAKGFTPGSATPSAEWGSVKSHAARTATKYGRSSTKKDTAEARRKKDKPKKKSSKKKRK